eukprot:2436805-Lingulodinium_polyedra.AAC.1
MLQQGRAASHHRRNDEAPGSGHQLVGQSNLLTMRVCKAPQPPRRPGVTDRWGPLGGLAGTAP